MQNPFSSGGSGGGSTNTEDDQDDDTRYVEGPGGVKVEIGDGQMAGDDAEVVEPEPEPEPDPEPDPDPDPTGNSSTGASGSLDPGSGGNMGDDTGPVDDRGAELGTGPLSPGTVGTGSGSGGDPVEVDPAPEPEPEPEPEPSQPSDNQDTLAGDPDSELVVDPDEFQSGDSSQIDQPSDVSNRTGQSTVEQGVDQNLDSAPNVVGAGPGNEIVDTITGGVDDGLTTIGDTTVNVGETVAGEVSDASRAAEETFRDQVQEPVAEDIEGDVRRFGEQFGISDSASSQIADIAGSGSLGVLDNFADVLGAPASAVGAADAAPDVAESIGDFAADRGTTAEEDGVPEATGEIQTATEATAAAAAGSAVDAVQEDPVRLGASLVSGAVLGTASARAAERGTSALRVAAETRRSDIDVDVEDVTSDRGAEGELPEFDTDPSAPTSEAVEEIRDRARDQPDQLQEELGEEVMLRSESQRLDADFEAGQGSYELPGLFASPDLSPLRLSSGANRGGVSLRLPKLFRAERASAFETDDIKAIPDDAAGSGRIEGPDGDLMPDPDAPGSQFLNQDADPGTAYVRPPGDRTTELEGIFAPGTRFQRIDTGKLNTDGRAGTIDLYRRADQDGAPDVPDAGDTVRFDEISRSSGGVPDDAPLTPGFGTSGPASGSGSGTGTTPTEVPDPTTDISGGGGSGSSGGPTSGDIFEPPATDIPGSDPPTTQPPVSGDPTDPPTSDPPTSDPPTTGPPTSGPPTSGPPTSDSPPTGPDDIFEPPSTGIPTDDRPPGGDTPTSTPSGGSPPTGTPPNNRPRTILPDFDSDEDDEFFDEEIAADQERFVRDLPDPSEDLLDIGDPL